MIIRHTITNISDPGFSFHTVYIDLLGQRKVSCTSAMVSNVTYVSPNKIGFGVSMVAQTGMKAGNFGWVKKRNSSSPRRSRKVVTCSDHCHVNVIFSHLKIVISIVRNVDRGQSNVILCHSRCANFQARGTTKVTVCTG